MSSWIQSASGSSSGSPMSNGAPQGLGRGAVGDLGEGHDVSPLMRPRCRDGEGATVGGGSTAPGATSLVAIAEQAHDDDRHASRGDGRWRPPRAARRRLRAWSRRRAATWRRGWRSVGELDVDGHVVDGAGSLDQRADRVGDAAAPTDDPTHVAVADRHDELDVVVALVLGGDGDVVGSRRRRS